MTAIVPVGPAVPVATPHRAVPTSSFGRLVEVEARKLVDTRAGFWLMVSGGLLTVLVSVLNTFFAVEAAKSGAGEGLSWIFATTSVGSALGIFLGLLAVLTITSEWSQRTALTTFALEPRRGRVLAAKGVVLVAATVALCAFSIGIAALQVAVAQAAGVPATWSMPLGELGGFLAMALLNTALGAAFGVLLQNSPAAIVAVFAVPIVWGIVMGAGALWEPLAKIGPWLVPSVASGALQSGTMTGELWAQLAVTLTIWLVVPAVIGTVRWLRRQVV